MAGGAFRLDGPGQAELVHVSDETWIAAPPADVAAAVARPETWERFFAGLAPRLAEARGVEGVRLTVAEPPGRGRGWHGTAELYVRAELEGTLLFRFLRLDPGDGRRTGRRAARAERDRQQTTSTAASWELKDALERR